MKKNAAKRALLMSAISLLLCVSMLVGTTFAWFTDSVTSANNIIKSGNLDVAMYWADGTQAVPSEDSGWTDASTGAIFNYQNWEPGYTEVRHIKIANEGNLALKYQVLIKANGEVSSLSDAIDVYYVDPAVQVANRAALTDSYKLGTLTEVLSGVTTSAAGELIANTNDTITIALKMRESAGNDYMSKEIGSDFSVVLMATQLTSESDSFDNQYDFNANYVTSATTLEDFFDAIETGSDVLLEETLAVNEEFMTYMNKRYPTATYAVAEDSTEISTNALIDGNGITIYRTEATKDLPIFQVATGYTLTLSNITLDGGAVWTGDVDATLQRGTVNSGMTTTRALVATEGEGVVVLNDGTILQNNEGANAISLATRGGGSLTLNGAQVINNASAAGAIWGGDDITINEGSKINGNHATSIGGAIRMVNGYNAITFTMNGGEINHNSSAGTGGAIWGGNNATYIFNGGEMAYNSAASAGGAIWTGTYEKYTITGNFEMHDNIGGELAGAIRFCDHSSLTMDGGHIYNNTVNGESSAFYLNNNSATITGGVIEDNFSYSGGLGLTIGEAGIDGVIHYNLGTNHKTAYLAASFNSFQFTVEESHVANFTFKPAADYTYTEGDEAKLVCLNDGYSTYWDASSSIFRLAAEG